MKKILLLLSCALLAACATKTDPKNAVPPAYGFSFGLSYGDAATATVTKQGGHTNFGVNVDAKEVVKVINRN